MQDRERLITQKSAVFDSYPLAERGLCIFKSFGYEHLIQLILTHIVLICILDEDQLHQYVIHLLFLFAVVLFSSKAH